MEVVDSAGCCLEGFADCRMVEQFYREVAMSEGGGERSKQELATTLHRQLVRAADTRCTALLHPQTRSAAVSTLTDRLPLPPQPHRLSSRRD